MNNLLIFSGNDIPFPGARIMVHQPTIKEISYVGEENFFTGYELLFFSKNRLSEQDRLAVEKFDNFEILIIILNQKENLDQKIKIEMFLSLLFPFYRPEVKENCFLLVSQDKNQENRIIDKNNFEDFKVILKKIFGFNKNNDDEYNPQEGMAQKIADKLNQRRNKLNELKNNNKDKSSGIFMRYISILSIGNQQNITDLLNYTVYQLFDAFERYELKVSYDVYIKAKMTGAQDIEAPEDWMKDIHC